MKSQFVFLFSFLLLFMVGCSAPEAPQMESATIPKLLDRSENIQLGKEWETVQNEYARLRDNLSKKPGDLKSKIELAALFCQEARVTGEHGHYFPAAQQLLDEAIANVGDDQNLKFQALALKASVQMSLHTFAEAEKTAREAVAINPHNAQIYGVLVDANVELGRYAEAVQLADKMVSIRPDLRSYSRVSYLREIHGDAPGAIEAMLMAVEAGYPGQEQRAWTMLQLGNLYQRYGQPDQAKTTYRSILEERPNYPFAVAALAELAVENGDLEHAETLLRQAIQSIPEVGFFEQLAAIYQQTGDKKEVARLQKEILEMLEDDTKNGHQMNLEYAAVYLDLFNDPEKALEFAKKEWASRPDNIDVNRCLSKIYLKMGDTAVARQHFEKAVATRSVHPELAELKKQLG